MFSFPPRTPVKALCKDCVVERCRILRLKNQLNEDYRTVTNLLKMTVKGYESPKCCKICFLEVLKQPFPINFPFGALKKGAVILGYQWCCLPAGTTGFGSEKHP